MNKKQTDLEHLQEKMHTLCTDFSIGDVNLDDFLYSIFNLLYTEYFDSDLTKGCEEIGVYLLSESAQAIFYCMVDSFINNPMTPVGSSSFYAESARAFKEGVDQLQKDGIIITAQIEDGNAENVLLSPRTCEILFKGREDFLKPSVISSFGEIIPWADIQEKQLIFSPALSKRLQMVSEAVEKDDTIMKELQNKGHHGSLTFLFSGPPGTGKTEFIMQLARTLKRSIIKIDASKIDSRYFGEAPKKLRGMFLVLKYISALYETPPITFMDEADGLLGKRVSVDRSEDRETNTMTNIILEELNDYRGVLFAATNHLENLDPAMDRRFLFKAVFPSPDASVRAKIWKSKIPDLSANQADELAQLFPFSGGYFDNVAKLYTIAQVINKKKPTFEEIKEFCVEQLGEKAKPVRKIGF